VIVESRVKEGTLTFGTDTGTDPFSCQVSNIRITPTADDDGDEVETLCGDKIAPGKKMSYTLAGTIVQDFDVDGFLQYCWDNQTETVPFTWTPNTTGAPTWTGDVVIIALEEGGDVNTRLTTDFEFDISGTPTRTPGAGGGAAAAESQTEEPAA
jgi:hypothetical protein